MSPPPDMRLFLLLLALGSAQALPKWNPGLTDRSDPVQEGLQVNLHLMKDVQVSAPHPTHSLHEKLSSVAKGAIDRVVHRPIQHGLGLISSVKGFVQKTIREPPSYPHPEPSSGHFGVGLHLGISGEHVKHNFGHSHHLDVGAELGSQHHHNEGPPGIHGGFYGMPPPHMNGGSQVPPGTHGGFYGMPPPHMNGGSQVFSEGSHSYPPGHFNGGSQVFSEGSHSYPPNHFNGGSQVISEGSHIYPPGHFNGGAHHRPMGFPHQGLHDIHSGSLDQIGQNSQHISSSPNNHQLVNQIGQETIVHPSGPNHDSQFGSSFNQNGGSHSLTPIKNNFGSQLASTIQQIVDTHLEATVQQNQAAHDALTNQLKPCPTCSFPSKITPEITHNIHIGQPQITVVTGTRVEIIKTCSGNKEDCKDDSKSSIPYPSKPEINHSSTASPPEESKPEEPESVNSEEVNEPDIVFIDDTKDLPISTEKSGNENDDIDIRFGSGNSKNTILNTKMSVNIRA